LLLRITEDFLRPSHPRTGSDLTGVFCTSGHAGVVEDGQLDGTDAAMQMSNRPPSEQTVLSDEKGRGEPAAGLPLVSIIVPARNEEKFIEGCLESLLAQDYPAVAEILVFDGCSEDRTEELVRALASRNPRIRLLPNPKVHQGAALNAGIQIASGEIIVRADAHAVYEPDYVSQCVHHLQTTGAANVGGPMRPAMGTTLCQQAIGFCYRSKFGLGVARFHDSRWEGYADTVWLGALWRRIFHVVGLYDEVPRGEDLLFNYRLRSAGYRIFLTPKIKSWYYSPASVWAFLWKFFANGQAEGEALFVLSGAIRWRHLVPLAFAVSLLVLLGGSLWFPPFLYGAALLVALHIATGLLFSLSGARQYGVGLLVAAPPLCLGLHLVHGWGTLFGILRAAFRRGRPEASSDRG